MSFTSDINITHDPVVCCGDTIKYRFYVTNASAVNVDADGDVVPPNPIKVTSTFDYTLNAVTLMDVQINIGSWDGTSWVIDPLTPTIQGIADVTLRVDDDSLLEYFVQINVAYDCDSCGDNSIKRIAKPLTCHQLDLKLNAREADCETFFAERTV